jgi:hypothetical protein
VSYNSSVRRNLLFGLFMAAGFSVASVIHYGWTMSAAAHAAEMAAVSIVASIAFGAVFGWPRSRNSN